MTQNNAKRRQRDRHTHKHAQSQRRHLPSAKYIFSLATRAAGTHGKSATRQRGSMRGDGKNGEGVSKEQKKDKTENKNIKRRETTDTNKALANMTT